MEMQDNVTLLQGKSSHQKHVFLHRFQIASSPNRKISIIYTKCKNMIKVKTIHQPAYHISGNKIGNERGTCKDRYGEQGCNIPN